MKLPTIFIGNNDFPKPLEVFGQKLVINNRWAMFLLLPGSARPSPGKEFIMRKENRNQAVSRLNKFLRVFCHIVVVAALMLSVPAPTVTAQTKYTALPTGWSWIW